MRIVFAIVVMLSGCTVTLEDHLGHYEGPAPYDEREAVAETLYLWHLVAELDGVELEEVETHWVPKSSLPRFNAVGLMDGCDDIWIAHWGRTDYHRTLAHEVLHCLLGRTEIGQFDHKSGYWFDPLDMVTAGLKQKKLLNWE